MTSYYTWTDTTTINKTYIVVADSFDAAEYAIKSVCDNPMLFLQECERNGSERTIRCINIWDVVAVIDGGVVTAIRKPYERLYDDD